jgi:predicted transcriptional regulator
MPREKREWLDLLDLKILSCLCYIDEGTAYEISKRLGVSIATVSERLKWLVECGCLQPPVEVTSMGRLKKIYSPPDKYFVFELIREFF